MTTLKTLTAAVALTLGSTMLYGTVDLDSGAVLAAQGEGGQGSGGQGSGGQGAGGQGSGGQGMDGQGSGGQGGSGGVPKGMSTEEEDDSDQKPWAGGGGKPDTGKPEGAGTMKGDLYGDLWVILRDENGVPILNEDGFVQPVDADGNPIALDEEGKPIDESLTQEVEFGRLNIGRAPDAVMDHAYDEALSTLNSAVSIELDSAGRLVATQEDGTVKTIDSPRENTALYITLLNEGYLPGLTADDEVLAALRDPSLTADDLEFAASLLAAGADKTGTLTVDKVAYLNSILGIAEMTETDYVDYSNFAYDRQSTYDGVEVTILEKQDDGSYLPTSVDIYDYLFDSQNYSDTGGIDSFTQASDDALQVIEFVHDNAF
jgi:hypothetical protein